MSSKSSILSMSVSDMRKEIECDQCEKSHPSKRCSRCHMTYYCGVECQKLHWKTHETDCIPVDEMKNRLVGVTNISSSTTIAEDTKQGTSECCSICLSEMVENPIVLPDCGHTFCFTCLMEWQNYTKHSITYRREPSSSQQGRCPYCRETIQESIVDAAIEKATLYAAAGRLTDKVYDHHLKTEQDNNADESLENPVVVSMDERQEKFCKLALEQVNQVLTSDPRHIIALCTKGQILRHVKPHDAIDALQEVLRIDEESAKVQEHLEQVVKELDEFRAEMDRSLTVEEIEDDNHPMVEEWARRVEAAEEIVAESTGKRIQINNGPFRLYSIKIMLAEAYESANKHEKAEAIYKEMIKEVFQLDYNVYLQIDPPTNRMMLSGASRCLFHLKDYDRAQKLAEMALDMNRHFPGIHVLVAQSQWAMNQKKDAIRTMCRGVLYETPWDESNQERNRVYLTEFFNAMNGTNHHPNADTESAE